jgi:hypothetical protein
MLAGSSLEETISRIIRRKVAKPWDFFVTIKKILTMTLSTGLRRALSLSRYFLVGLWTFLWLEFGNRRRSAVAVFDGIWARLLRWKARESGIKGKILNKETFITIVCLLGSIPASTIYIKLLLIRPFTITFPSTYCCLFLTTLIKKQSFFSWDISVLKSNLISINLSHNDVNNYLHRKYLYHVVQMQMYNDTHMYLCMCGDTTV